VKIENPLRRFRLLPAVMALSGALLIVKGAGLALEAQAQEQQSTPAAAQTAGQAAPADPAADDEADASSAQVDVLTSLAKRRAELDARERDLDMRQNLIAAAEKRVDGKIDSLKQLQTQIQALLGQRDAGEQKQVVSLVKTYSSMKPKDAAHIFDNLNEDVLLAVADQMKPDVLGAILAQMQTEAAQKLTVKLADRLKLPDAPPQAAPQQLATTATPIAAPGSSLTPVAQASEAPQPGAALTPVSSTAAPSAPAGNGAGGAASPQAQAPDK
jgi:flagellar motility protein MotE (MotC chaperone)